MRKVETWQECRKIPDLNSKLKRMVNLNEFEANFKNFEIPEELKELVNFQNSIGDDENFQISFTSEEIIQIKVESQVIQMMMNLQVQS